METTQKWQLPRIGSKFTGKPKGFVCTTSGTYWEILPTIYGDMLKLQLGLTKRKPSQKTNDNLVDQLKSDLLNYKGSGLVGYTQPTLANNGFLAIIFRKFWAWC